MNQVMTIAPEPPDDIERLLDVHQIAERLGIAGETVRQMVRRGDFPPPLEIGSRRLWRVADFNRWVQERPVAHSKAPARRKTR